MQRNKGAILAGLAGLAMGIVGGGASAQARAPGPFYPVHGGFYGRDYYHFGPRDHALWMRGRWLNDWHDGRYGWWWITGGYWYFYPVPVYPYPTYVPPAIVVQQPPPVPAGLPPMQSWYFCNNPQGYYPYVASCNGPWTAVPATTTTPPSNASKSKSTTSK
ncbi:MAG: hypothetical protein P4M00_08995 [Azospirillaceae bacterium]|nr:hypothetical protein [Azospirillaceae bacterium]